VILIGHCLGGMASILMAAFDERVKGVIAISTPYTFEETRVTRVDPRDMSRIRLKRYFHLPLDDEKKEARIDYSFFEDGTKKDMARAVRNLKQPTLLIHGSNDESIPLENVQEIADRAPGIKGFNIIEGMGHHPIKKDLPTLISLIENFLNEHL
jgi:pimeloyl-ACP methyl ester carboxylesterase